MRPKQWIKNAFVLAPLVFSGHFIEPDSLLKAFIATAIFCVASSATYVLNDIKDLEQDRQHPVKSRKRPIASGEVSLSQAKTVLVSLYVLLAVGIFIQPGTMVVVAIYMALNLAYSFFLKNQPVVDIFVIAIGFVLRMYAGTVAISVALSSWMFITTMCLALYLAAVKRRQELINSGPSSREVLNKYPVTLVNRYAEMSATGALLFYSMFVISVRPNLVFSIPLVLFGLFRYWYVVEVNGEGESPTDLLYKDWQLVLTIVLWLIFCAAVTVNP